MSRIKSALATLLLIAPIFFGPAAHAAPVVKVVAAGATAVWQALGLAAYKNGNCVNGGTAPCFHATYANVPLTDSRTSPSTVDKGSLWIVWDSAANTNVWAYISVDAVVGVRAYFAQPRAAVGSTSGLGTIQNLISASLWGNDTDLSSANPAVYALFTSSTGVSVNSAISDMRPEDALFEACRVNSALGGGADGLAGLGYGLKPSGVCPTFSDPLSNKVGTPLKSGYPGSSSQANVLAFSISGHDPFTNNAIPAATTVSIGAAPVVFITNRIGALKTVTNATDGQLQAVFSGTNCTGSVFAGGAATAIQAYLRDPLAGTFLTAESDVFRYPDVSGVSQETGVNAANPLTLPCSSGGSRYRAIGTSEEVKSVKNSNTNNGTDGIGYTYFSYGNVSSIASTPSYGYLTLNGVDPIFHKYGTGNSIDPGEPVNPGNLPGVADLPAGCASSFPCAESSIWSGHLSFPNLRNGSYRAWSVLRLISNGTALAAGKLLVTGSQSFVVNSVPDYVPFVKVGTTDPGLALLRSHSTQEGVSPVNVATTGDKGGDSGGAILTSTGLAATSDTTTHLGQTAPGNSPSLLP
jgi:hypothetical protein